MKMTIVLVASLGVAAAAPAFAGSGHKAKTSVTALTAAPAVVAASARTSDFQFHLDKAGPLQSQPIPPQNGEVFAAPNEVALEDYSFDLK